MTAQQTTTAVNNSPSKSSSNIQVIFNGKIVTPQSLIPRKIAASPTQKRPKHDFSSVPATIDETEQNEKVTLAKPVLKRYDYCQNFFLFDPNENETNKMNNFCFSNSLIFFVFSVCF